MTEHTTPEGEESVSVRRQIASRAEPEEIWAHLVDGDLAGVWLDGDVEIDPRPGGDIRLRREGAPAIWGTIEEVAELSRIQWSWRTDHGLPTLVEIDLTKTSSGTRVTVTETLLPWRFTGPDGVWEGPVARARVPTGSLSAA